MTGHNEMSSLLIFNSNVCNTEPSVCKEVLRALYDHVSSRFPCAAVVMMRGSDPYGNFARYVQWHNRSVFYVRKVVFYVRIAVFYMRIAVFL